MEAAMEHDFETVARNAGVELKKDSGDNLVTDAEGHYVVARKGPPPASKSPAISKLRLLPVRRAGSRYRVFNVAKGTSGDTMRR